MFEDAPGNPGAGEWPDENTALLCGTEDANQTARLGGS